MPHRPATTNADATRLVAYIVRPGEDRLFIAWQAGVNETFLKHPGALRVDVLPASMTEAGHHWIVLYRFHSEPDLQAWVASGVQEDQRHTAPDIFVGSETQYTLSGADAPDAGETMVTSNTVLPGREGAYEAADRALNEAAARFPGFIGTEVVAPRPGSRHWSTIIRFACKRDMDRWLTSPERAEGLLEMYRHTESHDARVVPTGFGSWFAVNAADSIEAPAWKQAMTVLAVLFPTVMLLTVTLGDWLAQRSVPLALNIFIGNLVSTVALTWALMPALTRGLAWWLSPGATRRQSLIGSALLAALYAAEIAIFLALTA